MTKIEYSNEMNVELRDFMGGDNQTAMSAWVSFGNDDKERLANRKGVEGLINFLYRERHMSPFESSVFTFRIECPIFVAREIFTHRTGSYNEWSGRYSVLEPKFYVPSTERPLVQAGKAGEYFFVEGSNDQYAYSTQAMKRICKSAYRAYEDIQQEGVAKEVARMLLPVNVYTKFYMTMNARNVMHFLDLRTSPQALYEIRLVAEQMEKHLAERMPITYAAYRSER